MVEPSTSVFRSPYRLRKSFKAIQERDCIYALLDSNPVIDSGPLFPALLTVFRDILICFVFGSDMLLTDFPHGNYMRSAWFWFGVFSISRGIIEIPWLVYNCLFPVCRVEWIFLKLRRVQKRIHENGGNAKVSDADVLWLQKEWPLSEETVAVLNREYAMGTLETLVLSPLRYIGLRLGFNRT